MAKITFETPEKLKVTDQVTAIQPSYVNLSDGVEKVAAPPMKKSARWENNLSKATDEAWKLSGELALTIIEKLAKGATIVECVGWLMRDQKMSIQMAQEVINFAVKETIGKMDHGNWTDTYRMLSQDLYQQSLAQNKLAIANQVLGNMIKLQYLSQSKELREREAEHEEKKLETTIKFVTETRENELNVKKGKDSTEGFRLQIESFSSTQSTPLQSEIIDAPLVAEIKTD